MSHDNEPDSHPITLINVFEIPVEHMDDFIRQWRQRAELMTTKPGFIDSRLHRAVTPSARFPLVNIAHWESRDAWESATVDAEFQRRTRAATERIPIVAYPAAYHVVVEFSESPPDPPSGAADDHVP